MASKFYDAIGYAESQETTPGVWKDVITEHMHYGDVLRNSRTLKEGDKVNNDISVGSRISVVMDAYANMEHYFAMRYIKWLGNYWTISKVDVEAPRLVLWLGGEYNGPKASPPPDTP